MQKPSPGRRVVRAGFALSSQVLVGIGKISPTAKDHVSRLFAPLHVALYRRTGGRRAFEPGAPTLLLTTPGRRTGKPRTTPLFYLPDGQRCVLVASYGGDDRHPQWYLNLMAAGEALVQLGAHEQRMRAEVASAAERARLWPRLVDNWPSYASYQRQTARELPVVVLTAI